MYKDIEDFMNPNPGTPSKKKQVKHKSRRKQKSLLIGVLPIIIFAVLLINMMSSRELSRAINQGATIADAEDDVVQLGYAVSRDNLSERETKDFIKDNYDGYPSYYLIQKALDSLEVNYKESASNRVDEYALDGYGRSGIRNMLSENGFTDEEVDYAMEHVSEP